MKTCKCGTRLMEGEKRCRFCAADNAENYEKKPKIKVNNIINKTTDMSLWQGFVSAFKNCTNFKSRASRKEFWGYMVFYFVFASVIYTLDWFVLSKNVYGGLVDIALRMSLTAPVISIWIRRLHDTGKSGWNVLWCLTIIGIIPLWIWCCVAKSRN